MVGTDASLFEFLQKDAPDGIWYWNPQHPDDSWQNTRFWTLLGYTAENKRHLGSRWYDLIDTDDWQVLHRQVKRQGGAPRHPHEQVLRCQHKDGSTIFLRCRAFSIHQGEKTPSRILCTVTDLTSQKLTEQRLKKSPAFLEAIFNSIQDGISVLDHNLNIVSVNRTMEKWYARKLPLEGKKCYTVYHGRREACDTCPTALAMQSGKLEMSEIPLFRQGERIGTLELYAFPMLNKAGQTEAVVEYVRDITARKQAESLMMEREQLFRSLFEENYSAMLLIDPDSGAIVDANPSACAFYGYPKNVLTAMHIIEINTLSQAEVFKEMEKAKSEKRNYFDFRHRLADGTIREVEVYSGPITIGGRSMLCSIVHDVSARKAVEREKESLIEKLQKALSEVKTLRGFLPICASCKKIRDDKGYWNQIETYIREHSEAEFSHGLCPECARRLYPDLDIKPKP